jgi:hypothetical protein
MFREGDLAQFPYHQVGGHLGALGALRHGLSTAAAISGFLRFSWPITRAVLAL